MEENNRMGKTRELFKKIRDTKGTFHAKMGSIKKRNSMALTEAEDIKKRRQEYTEELYKKDLSDPDNHNGVITHLEPDILECEVKWALGNINMNKASGGDWLPDEWFQILKDDAALYKPANLENSAVVTGLEKVIFHSNPKERQCQGMFKHTIALISHTSKVMLKILQARLQQYVNWEIPDIQAGFRKGRGTRDQIANIRRIIEKAREFQKNIYLCFIDYAKPLTVWITINCGKFWKRWEYQTTWPASWEICMQVKKQQLELDIEQQTGSKYEKEYVKAVYCHPA